MKKRGYSIVGIMAIVCSPVWAAPESVTEDSNISFGNVVIRSSGAVIKMEADGTISQGSTLILSPPVPTAGNYRVQGDPGTVDIAITNVAACGGGVMVDGFAADWGGAAYADISSTAITGAPFDGDEPLRLGARISYPGTVSLGACPTTFDLTVIYY